MWARSHGRHVGTELSDFTNLPGLLRLFLRTAPGRLTSRQRTGARRSREHSAAAEWGGDSAQEVTQHRMVAHQTPGPSWGERWLCMGHNAPKS